MRKSERQLHFQSWKRYQMQTSEMAWASFFHEWITLDFGDKLSYGNRRVSGGGQVDHETTGKMSSRKISGRWASAGTRLKRLCRTGGAGGIVSPNASLTRDEPGTRNCCESGIDSRRGLDICTRFKQLQ